MSRYLPEGRISHAARRHIHDARQVDFISRVGDHAQIRQHILDFLTVVKLHAAGNLIRHVGPAQRVLHHARQGIHSIKNRHGVPGNFLFFMQVAKPPHNQVRLVVLVLGEKGLGLVPFGILGPESLFLPLRVGADQARSDVENFLRGAVILLEPNDSGVGIIFLEVEDNLNVRAAQA